MSSPQNSLIEFFTARPVLISVLQPADVREFFATELEHCGSVSHAKALASALRAYFHYRTVCGDQVGRLLGVIASPAQWSLASLPRSLTDERSSVCSNRLPRICARRGGVMPWSDARSILDCEPARSPSSR